jgi:hypothetical protein
LPTAADRPAMFYPLPQKSNHGRSRRDDKSPDWGIQIAELSSPNGVAVPS